MTNPGPQEFDTNPTPGSLEFSRDLEIQGLSYVFEGTIPQNPGSFEWVMRIPDWSKNDLVRWTDEVPFAIRALQSLRALKLGDGTVGIIRAAEYNSDTGQAIWLSRIQTATRSSVPREHDYHDANGVGSFLLDELCTLADQRGWEIHLTPEERRGSRLNQGQLYRWYLSRGFEDGVGDMVRFPLARY
ncbi:MAG: hypothetical protein R3313_03340 [Candidatus Saccharimonadales bacterium]|nr:hypothetical protein [Candidatus Saccharimonadales bacterium]